MSNVYPEILAAIGLTFIIKDGKIFSSVAIPLRALAQGVSWLGMLLACSLCLGFWSGVAVHMTVVAPRLAFLIMLGGAAFFSLVGITLMAPTPRHLMAWASLGAILAAFPGALIAMPLTMNLEILPQLGLAGLRAAPICFLFELIYQKLEPSA